MNYGYRYFHFENFSSSQQIIFRMIEIYHNNSCSKSRNALAILREKGIDFSIRNYIEQPLNQEEIQRLQSLLNVPLIDMVRTNESIFKEKFSGTTPTENDLILALLQYPILLQRPIVVNGDRAIIARPSERVLEIMI